MQANTFQNARPTDIIRTISNPWTCDLTTDRSHSTL